MRDAGHRPDHASPEERRARLPVADLAASFQAAVVDVLATQARRAPPQTFGARRLALGGGVAANRILLRTVEELRPDCLCCARRRDCAPTTPR